MGRQTGKAGRQAERQASRLTDGETDRLSLGADKVTDRQTDEQMGRQTDRQMGGWADRVTAERRTCQQTDEVVDVGHQRMKVSTPQLPGVDGQRDLLLCQRL